MPDDRSVGDSDRNDSDDSSAAGLANRMASVARVMSNMNSRLEKIQAGFSTPPDDVKPEMLTALNDIKTQANHAITIADSLIRLLGPSDPIPG